MTQDQPMDPQSLTITIQCVPSAFEPGNIQPFIAQMKEETTTEADSEVPWDQGLDQQMVVGEAGVEVGTTTSLDTTSKNRSTSSHVAY